MNEMQRVAIENHCRFAFETAQDRFRWVTPRQRASIILTVNSGYE